MALDGAKGRRLAYQLQRDSVMRKLLQTLAISALLWAQVPPPQPQISFGIRIGEPPAPRAYRVPPQPGPDYEWVEGYQYPQGNHYAWHNGYWTRGPHGGGAL